MLDLDEHLVEPFGQALGYVHVAQWTVLDARRFGRTHDHPVLVDPHRHGDVGEPEQLIGDVALVDQRRMVRLRRLDPLTRSGGAACIEGDGDDFDAVLVLLSPEGLPPGQARSASSPRRPGDEQDLPAS